MIETERLLIRPLAADERDAMFALMSNPANERVAPDATPEQVRSWADGVPCGVWERETGELIGDCSLHFDTAFGEWELSYGFRRDRWGRGYATEAARACVQYGFETMKLAKIVADVDPANVRSARVLEKCGFVRIGKWGENLLYEVTGSARARPR